MEKKNNTWKTIAIVFIVLFAIETLIFGAVWNLGNRIIEQEEACIYDICSDSRFTAFTYDEINEVCYCYEGEDATVIHRFA